MTMHTHILVDSAQAIVADGAVFQGNMGNDSPPWQAKLRVYRGGRSEGVGVVEIDNGAMTIDVLPTRGMGIWRVRRGDQTLGWQAPARNPVHPAFVPLTEPSGLGWLDGFNELLCRCGLESNGAPVHNEDGQLVYPLHGRIANSPAHRVELEVDDEKSTITLRGIVDEARIFFQSLRLTSTLTTSIGSNHFTWTDEVENIGGRDASMQMLYHFNVGLPLLRAGARVAAPIAAVAPKTDVAASAGIDTWNIIPPPRADSSEQVYVADLAADTSGDTRVLLNDLANGQAVSLSWNKASLPCFTLWRNTLPEVDGYVVGLEPATNYPNPRPFEKQHGRVVELKPGQKWQASVTATWHAEPSSITAEQDAIRAIQNRTEPQTFAQPRPEWSA